MNILDQNVFFGEPDPAAGDYFLRNRRSFRVLATTLPAPERELLYCRQATFSHLLEGARYHHRQKGTLSVEYVESGNILFRNGGEVYALESGELFLFQPGGTAEFMVRPGCECRKHSLEITGRLLAEFLRQSGLDRVSGLSGVDLPVLTGFFREFEVLLNRHDADEARENGAKSYTFLQFLQSPRSRGSRPLLLNRMLECMNSREAGELRLEEIAAFCRCSPAHLIRLCREHFGETPHRMLLAIRMRRAAAALLAEELTVKEIAAAAGYASAQNFATEFRKFFGSSPRSYRKNTILN